MSLYDFDVEEAAVAYLKALGSSTATAPSLDTSGSMSGLPETVAKAVTLEALRVAHAEKRACYLYAFSGPEQVDEDELDLSPEGLGRLLAFLGCSFYGGTDVEAPIRRTLARLKQERWKRADVLVVSDGEFPISGGLGQEVQRATEDGTPTRSGTMKTQLLPLRPTLISQRSGHGWSHESHRVVGKEQGASVLLYVQSPQ